MSRGGKMKKAIILALVVALLIIFSGVLVGAIYAILLFSLFVIGPFFFRD